MLTFYFNAFFLFSKIAMAVQMEQIYNAKRVVQKGFTVGLDIKTLLQKIYWQQ